MDGGKEGCWEKKGYSLQITFKKYKMNCLILAGIKNSVFSFSHGIIVSHFLVKHMNKGTNKYYGLAP